VDRFFQVAQQASKVWLEAKVIPAPIDPASVVGAGFVQEAR